MSLSPVTRFFYDHEAESWQDCFSMAEKPSAQFTKHISTASTSNGHPRHQGSSSLLLLMSPAFAHEPRPRASSSLLIQLSWALKSTPSTSDLSCSDFLWHLLSRLTVRPLGIRTIITVAAPLYHALLQPGTCLAHQSHDGSNAHTTPQGDGDHHNPIWI